MTPLARQIISEGRGNRVLTERQLARLVKGSDQSRYGLVNRALKAGELLRVKRGLYVLANELREVPVHPFALAQHIVPGSYVTGETALGFHGWIPEAVRTVLSATATGKSVTYEHERLGSFEFRRMTVRPGYFLEAVSREVLKGQVALVASPIRALMDLVYLRKRPWKGLGFLLEGLRIDEESLMRTSSAEIIPMLEVYKGKREREFIEELLRELGLDD
ncbi:type IV toxin-antitoxin system AbiEi family antitoxin domain-containing protein [Thiohalomonas denitrificans]|uniref:type IV toxin-antitoxin system AbiEi family antitoxin domain-containing protein n=1 Tax=Thiohalomonas denitrificans TaxID=415747 RepID=UPI0026E94E03|nr:hypothetical protein [Thiohalomonas denitrificans]